MNADEYQEFQSSLEHGAESSKHGPDAYFGKHIIRLPTLRLKLQVYLCVSSFMTFVTKLLCW